MANNPRPRLPVTALAGEWWLIDGAAVGADGDIGDVNHAAVVFNTLLSEFVDATQGSPVLASMFPEHVDPDAWDPIMLREVICNWADAQQKAGKLTSAETDDIDPLILKEAGWDAKKYEILTGYDDNAETREYGMQHLGWVRVAGNNIEAWQLSPRLLGKIADGLYDAHDEACEKATYEVEERSTGALYVDVPYRVLAAASFTKLARYRRLGVR